LTPWSGAEGADLRRELSFLGFVRTQVEPLSLSQEDLMFELNFSSNADWIVAVLLAVTVVAAALV
jgi:hypothetical protein